MYEMIFTGLPFEIEKSEVEIDLLSVDNFAAVPIILVLIAALEVHAPIKSGELVDRVATAIPPFTTA